MKWVIAAVTLAVLVATARIPDDPRPREAGWTAYLTEGHARSALVAPPGAVPAGELVLFGPGVAGLLPGDRLVVPAGEPPGHTFTWSVPPA